MEQNCEYDHILFKFWILSTTIRGPYCDFDILLYKAYWEKEKKSNFTLIDLGLVLVIISKVRS